jgi:hypothetical protein
MLPMPAKITPQPKTFYFLPALLPFIFYLLTFDSYAAPCYGTKMPAKNELFAGIQSYTIFKRYLEHESGKLRSTQEFLSFSYGISDWLSLNLKGGAGYIKAHPKAGDEVDYPTYFGGGYGLRLSLFEQENIKAVLGFQHISIHPKTVSLSGKKHKAVLDDWQFSLLGSYQLKKITPYLGARWSRTGYIHWADGERELVRSDLTKDIGVILGIDLPVAENIWLNLEGSLLDSQAVALSLNYRF